MSAEQQAKRVEAAARVLRPGDFAPDAHPADADRTREHAAEILAAADEAVPMVSADELAEIMTEAFGSEEST